MQAKIKKNWEKYIFFVKNKKCGKKYLIKV